LKEHNEEFEKESFKTKYETTVHLWK